MLYWMSELYFSRLKIIANLSGGQIDEAWKSPTVSRTAETQQPTYVFTPAHYRNFHGRWDCHASIKHTVSTTIRDDQWANTLLIYRPVDIRRPRLSVLELGTQNHYPTLLRTFDTEYTYPSYNTHNNSLWRKSNFTISVEVGNVGYGLSLPPTYL